MPFICCSLEATVKSVTDEASATAVANAFEETGKKVAAQYGDQTIRLAIEPVTLPVNTTGAGLTSDDVIKACKEMAMRNLTKPVSMRDGISNGPRNGTPAYMFEVLMREYSARAGYKL